MNDIKVPSRLARFSSQHFFLVLLVARFWLIAIISKICHPRLPFPLISPRNEPPTSILRRVSLTQLHVSLIFPFPQQLETTRRERGGFVSPVELAVVEQGSTYVSMLYVWTILSSGISEIRTIELTRVSDTRPVWPTRRISLTIGGSRAKLRVFYFVVRSARM